MQIWFTILVSWPAPLGPIRVTARAKVSITGRARSKGSGSPPHMTVRVPFSAPAWPPETGASMKAMPRSLPAAASSRATSAEAVVLSTKMLQIGRASCREKVGQHVYISVVYVPLKKKLMILFHNYILLPHYYSHYYTY